MKTSTTAKAIAALIALMVLLPVAVLHSRLQFLQNDEVAHIEKIASLRNEMRKSNFRLRSTVGSSSQGKLNEVLTPSLAEKEKRRKFGSALGVVEEVSAGLAGVAATSKVVSMARVAANASASEASIVTGSDVAVTSIVDPSVNTIADPVADIAAESTGPTRRGRFWRASPAETAASDIAAIKVRARVRAAMVHSWSNYETQAWGRDEVRPTAGDGNDRWGGLGMTMLDSLDTLWVMGMHEEFDRAVGWVESKFAGQLRKAGKVSTFETTIRALGGLLGGYALSRRPELLAAARLMGDALMPAFNTDSGYAAPTVELSSGSVGLRFTSLAEVASLQLEFTYLSKLTGDTRYEAAAAKAHDNLWAYHQDTSRLHGMFPSKINPRSGKLKGEVTWGAAGDSAYEYLLKCWIAGGRRDERLVEMYEMAVRGMEATMLRRSAPSNLAYVSGSTNTMEHLACFLPGLLALDTYVRPERGKDADARLQLAEDLAYTCYQMYERMPTGLAPEAVNFGGARDFFPRKWMEWNILRPETAESIFILHEITGDPKYRAWGAKIIDAFEKHSKAPFGYGAHPDVSNPQRVCCNGNDDKEESFWLAETLKYLYLLQDPTHEIALDRYVLTTEAHPVKI